MSLSSVSFEDSSDLNRFDDDQEYDFGGDATNLLDWLFYLPSLRKMPRTVEGYNASTRTD